MPHTVCISCTPPGAVVWLGPGSRPAIQGQDMFTRGAAGA